MARHLVNCHTPDLVWPQLWEGGSSHIDQGHNGEQHTASVWWCDNGVLPLIGPSAASLANDVRSLPEYPSVALSGYTSANKYKTTCKCFWSSCMASNFTHFERWDSSFLLSGLPCFPKRFFSSVNLVWKSKSYMLLNEIELIQQV